MKISMLWAGAVVLTIGVSQAQAQDVAAGETLYSNSCSQCHGPKAKGMASFPSLAGKEAEYLSSRLEQYRAGERVGPNSGLMIPNAKNLSDADIANLAAYISTTFQ
jgi:cytochrome c553